MTAHSGIAFGSLLRSRRLALAAGVCVLTLAVSVVRGKGEQVGGDFHAFWQAGSNYATGAPLYHGDLPGARKFIYPPFAAMIFQVFALFPLHIAAVIASLISLLLFGVSIFLTRSIVARLFPTRAAGALPLVCAAVLSLHFFLDNFNRVQINEVIFVFILLGIDAQLRAQDFRSAAYFVVATAIKITPGFFFVLWLLVRGRPRAALAVPPLALACVVVPLLARGPTTGATDLAEYYHSFLMRYQQGEVWTSTRNQDVGAMVYRMMRPEEHPEQLNYQYLPASEETAALTYKASAGLLLLLFLITLGRLRARRADLSPFELSAVFLIGHLLSPITERAHLVTLVFVFYTFFALRPATLSPSARFGLVGLWALIGLSGLSGRDIVGRDAYYYMGGYSIVVWMMLLLFVASVVMMLREATALRAPDATRAGGQDVRPA